LIPLKPLENLRAIRVIKEFKFKRVKEQFLRNLLKENSLLSLTTLKVTSGSPLLATEREWTVLTRD
jgi:hypothetical protein